jgi:hypothetical protein
MGSENSLSLVSEPGKEATSNGDKERTEVISGIGSLKLSELGEELIP